MSDQRKSPVDTHRDGAVFAKVWRNHTQEGKPYYSISLGRTYTDPETQQPRTSHSFSAHDARKLPSVMEKAQETILQQKEQDKENRQANEQGQYQQQEQQQYGLEQQHREAMQHAHPDPAASQQYGQQREHAPVQSRGR